MSKPKVYLYRDGHKRVLLPPASEGMSSVEVKGETCPHCKEPLKVAGAKMRIGGHDFYTAEAGCISCGAYLGELRAYISTIFGLEEDRRVLSSGVRIY